MHVGFVICWVVAHPFKDPQMIKRDVYYMTGEKDDYDSANLSQPWRSLQQERRLDNIRLESSDDDNSKPPVARAQTSVAELSSVKFNLIYF